MSQREYTIRLPGFNNGLYMANYARQTAGFPAIPGEAGIYLANSLPRQKFGDLIAWGIISIFHSQ